MARDFKEQAMMKKSPAEIFERGKSGLERASCCGNHRWE
jgi:hypothetical protein